MFSLRALRDALTDDSLRFALLLGFATIPFTLALSWGQVGSDGVVIGGSVSGEPLVLAGLLVGYYYSNRPTESRRAGLWTGIVGAIATILIFGANTITTIGSSSPEMTAVVVVLTLVGMALGVGFSALITMISAMITDRVTKRLRNRGGSDWGEPADPSRWWQAVPIYALMAPLVLLSVLWVGSGSSVWFVASILGVLALMPLSIATLVGLFIDATEPKTEWVPQVGIYVGVPIAVAALVFLAATGQGRINPSGDAVYGFVIALWITSVAYATKKYRHTGTLQFR